MPIEWHSLAVFLIAALSLNLTPGNDMMYVIGQCLKGGIRSGVAASFGIATGSCVHIALVALGVAGLLASYPAVFETLRWAGVIYLLWLAIKSFASPGVLQLQSGERRSGYRAWRDGVFVNVLNPKVAVFMLAFLPQFVDPARGSVVLQICFLGFLFNLGGTSVLLAVCAIAGRLGKALAARREVASFVSIVSGSIFLFLAAKLAFDRR